MRKPTLNITGKVTIVFLFWTMGLTVPVPELLAAGAEETTSGGPHGSFAGVKESVTAEGSSVQPGAEIQERGVPQKTPRKMPKGMKILPPPKQGNEDLPANLCRQETHMLTECRCSNDADCQVLSTLCPGSCPAGSQSCQCIPMFRGSPPPLPQNLCGYQVPFTITECSCSNQAECQLLTPYCPSACPAGSQTCTCRPLRRGN